MRCFPAVTPIAPPASNFSPSTVSFPLVPAISPRPFMQTASRVSWNTSSGSQLLSRSSHRSLLTSHPLQEQPNVNSLSSFHLPPGTAPHQPVPLHDQDDDADEDGDQEAEAQQQRVFQHILRRDLWGMAWGQNHTAAPGQCQVMLMRALGLLGAPLRALTLHFPQPLPAVNAATQRRSLNPAVGWVPAWVTVAVFLVIAHLQMPEWTGKHPVSSFLLIYMSKYTMFLHPISFWS